MVVREKKKQQIKENAQRVTQKNSKIKKTYLQGVEVDWPHPSHCLVVLLGIAQIHHREKDRSHLSSHCALSASPGNKTLPSEFKNINNHHQKLATSHLQSDYRK